jgi:glycosyltransferase involved in cell wall biosynthesis
MRLVSQEMVFVTNMRASAFSSGVLFFLGKKSCQESCREKDSDCLTLAGQHDYSKISDGCGYAGRERPLFSLLWDALVSRSEQKNSLRRSMEHSQRNLSAKRATELPALSVVMPALNEEESLGAAIAETLAAIDRFGITGEIIVINDGSTDRTGDIARVWTERDPRVRLLVHEHSQGIGASFWDGVCAATMDSVVMLPGDNENDPDEIMRYFPLLHHVDIVIPFLYDREARPFFRNALSYLYRFIVNTTFLMNINYTNGTVLYRRDVLQVLTHRSNGFFFQTDILIRLIRRGYLFAEVPYRVKAREHGRSKAVTFPSLYWVVRGYIRLMRDIYGTKGEEGGGYPLHSLTWWRKNTGSAIPSENGKPKV